MRRLLLFALAACLLAPAGASAQVAAPADPTGSGGAGMGLGARGFHVAPGVFTAGSPVTVSFRARGPVSTVHARGVVGKSVLALGEVPTGQVVGRRWTPDIAAGSYKARLVLRAGGLKRIRTFPVTVSAAPAPVSLVASKDGVFPVRGQYSFGGEGSRFGSSRGDHIHQGQDISAAHGTPLVSPVDGTVYWRKVQPGGAGHYLIIRDAKGVDYVFMHLAAGSELVEKGDTVRAGQRIAAVGNTGSSQGPHLHFEIWPDGWYAPQSEPIDPLPTLRAWAAG